MKDFSIRDILHDLFSTRSILAKLSVVFLLLIILPVSIIGYISTSSATTALIDKTEEAASNSTMQTMNYFDMVLNKAESLSMQVFTDSSVQKYGRDQLSIIEQKTLIQDKQRALDVINAINSTSDQINVKLLFDNGKTIGDMTAQADMGKIRTSSWYKTV